jgi:hypothetical protein
MLRLARNTSVMQKTLDPDCLHPSDENNYSSRECARPVPPCYFCNFVSANMADALGIFPKLH